MTSAVSTRLVLWLAVPLTLMSLLGGLIDYFINYAPALTRSELRLTDAAAALVGQLQVKDGQIALIGSVHQMQASEDRSVAYVVRDAKERVVSGDPQLPLIRVKEPNYPFHSRLQLDSRDVRALTYRIETAAGPVTITVIDTFGGSETSVSSRFGSILIWDFVQLAITLILVWLGVQLGLQPIRNLGGQIADRSPQDLRHITEASVPKDMLPLTGAVNRLFTMVSSSIEAQQKFIVDTAHQLRTPITGVAAQLDLLASDPAAQPVKHRVTALQEGIRQLTHSTNQLLNLARAESAIHVLLPKNIPVDLKSIADEVAARFVDRAVAANIDLGVDTQSASIRANPSLLDDLLSNLVDNALKYTPAGGVVTVHAGVANDHPFLEVEDNGRGIPDSERQRVRERFYRSPNSPGQGTGLGLAIVDEIAKLYGASVSLSTGSAGQGTRVRVQFPAAMVR